MAYLLILCFDLVWISSPDLLFLCSSTLHRSVRLLASFAWLREEKARTSDKNLRVLRHGLCPEGEEPKLNSLFLTSKKLHGT